MVPAAPAVMYAMRMFGPSILDHSFPGVRHKEGEDRPQEVDEQDDRTCSIGDSGGSCQGRLCRQDENCDARGEEIRPGAEGAAAHVSRETLPGPAEVGRVDAREVVTPEAELGDG